MLGIALLESVPYVRLVLSGLVIEDFGGQFGQMK
jgi:hypothetical protein